MLRGGRVVASIDALLLGVDLDRVDFLTQVGIDDLRSALDAIHAGVAEVDERLTLTMRASRAVAIPTGFESLLQ
jgi:NAD+ kinase